MATQSSHQKRGLRIQFMVALGSLIGLFGLALTVAIILVTTLQKTTATILNDEVNTSRLTSQVALATLLCRRYEKDLFLSIGNPEQVAQYRPRWENAHTNLVASITAFGTAQPENQAQAAEWQGITDEYHVKMQDIMAAIDAGIITTPDQANVALTPFKDPIRRLTDSAQVVAADSASRAVTAENNLQAQTRNTLWIVALVSIVALIGAIVLIIVLPNRLLSPIHNLHATTRQFAHGDLTARATIIHDDEVGALAASFNQMAESLVARTSALEKERQEADIARAAAEQGRTQLAEQLAIVADQRVILRELSVPLLPLSERAMAMPLVGALDSARMAMAQERALTILEQHSIHDLLLDVTGVPVIDTQVASGLLSLIEAARLMGSEVALVGIQPEVAQTLVQLGLTLDGIRIYRNMQQGIETIIHL